MKCGWEWSVCGRCASPGYSDTVKHPSSLCPADTHLPQDTQLPRYSPFLPLSCRYSPTPRSQDTFSSVLQTVISMWGRGYWRILRYHRPLPTIRPPHPLPSLASFSAWQSLDFFSQKNHWLSGSRRKERASKSHQAETDEINYICEQCSFAKNRHKI